MSQTRSATASQTYTVADIEEVVINVKADLVMIADSTGVGPLKRRETTHTMSKFSPRRDTSNMWT